MRANALTPAQLAGQPWFRTLFKSLQRHLLTVDGHDHARLRSLVSKAFTPRQVERMRGRIQALTDQLIDAVSDRGGCDLIGDFALPLSLTVISEMLGVPVADRHAFHRWSKALLSASHSSLRMLNAVPNAILFLRYLRRFVRIRRADPQNDLVSALIQAEENGDRLSEDDLNRPCPPGGPGVLTDVASVFELSSWHEGMHSGQLTMLRRALGHPPNV